MADDESSKGSEPLSSIDFQNLERSLLINEILVMIRRLQDHGEFQVLKTISFDRLSLKELKHIKGHVRDTLRTLGGGR